MLRFRIVAKQAFGVSAPALRALARQIGADHDRRASNTLFARVLPAIVCGATDEREMVKKAVNWALRQIGKRNRAFHRAAIRTALEIRRIDSFAARWIAPDALQELRDPRVRRRLLEKSRRTARMP